MESQAGDSKENGRETPPEILETLPFLGTPPPIPVTGQHVPLKPSFDAPRALSLVLAHLLWPDTPRAAVWRSSGTVASAVRFGLALGRAGFPQGILKLT